MWELNFEKLNLITVKNVSQHGKPQRPRPTESEEVSRMGDRDPVWAMVRLGRLPPITVGPYSYPHHFSYMALCGVSPLGVLYTVLPKVDK
jgi:hypothetical protein